MSASYTFGAVGAASAGTSVTPGAPIGVSVGNLLIMPAVCRNNGDTMPALSGWTSATFSVMTWCALYLRIADGTAGDTPPTFNSSGSNPVTSQCAYFTGNVYTNLASIVDTEVDTNLPGLQSVVKYQAMTPSLNNDLIIAIGGKNKSASSNGTTYNALPGFTQIGQTVTNGNTVSLYWGYQQQTTATTIAAQDQTFTGTTESLQYDGALFALKTLAGVAGMLTARSNVMAIQRGM